MQRMKINTFLTLLFVALATATQAQTGKITGKVLDAETGEDLIGVTVLIQGTSIGSATDFEGNFSISNVPVGKHSLVFSFISYNKKIVDSVVVKDKEVVVVEISMSEAVNELGPVVVKSEMRKETTNSLLLQQKKNVSISDGISAEMIKKTPDATTGDIMKRVSGTSIQDNKFAVIRGLNDRYNTAYINGAPLPSTESDRKAFSFDIFPSNMLDNMVISKTASADLPGDFAGGLITINTRDIPDKKFVSTSVGMSYHSITTGEKGNGYEGGKTDWLGYDNGKRTIPGDIPARGQYNNQPVDRLVTNSKFFNDNWKTESISSLTPNFSLQLAGGNSYKTGKRGEFGFIVSGSYSNGYRNSYVQRNQFNKPIGGDNQLLRSYEDTITKHEILGGLMANFGFKINDNNKFTFKNAYTVNSEDQTILRGGNDDYLTETLPLIRGVYYNYSQSKLLTQQLTGDHYLDSSKTKIHWVLNNNVINREIPDFRRFTQTANLIDPGANDGIYTPYAARISSSNPDITQTGRFFSSLRETIRSAGVDLSKPLKFLSNKKVSTETKFGVFWQVRERDFQARAFAPILSQNAPNRQQFLEGSLDTLFNSSNYSNTFYFKEDFRAQDVYTASSNLKVAYLMFNQRISTRLRLSYGVRYESYLQKLNSFEKNSEPPKAFSIDTVFNDFLPSANFTYELTEKINLRASGSRTLARPEFREIAPFAFYDFNLNTVVTGKPNLTRTRINNYDLRFEYYPGEGQLMSASLFYKDFSNPIEAIYENIGSDATLGYTSDAKATNYGLEVELRKNLDFLDKLLGTKWLKKFSFTCNYAYIISSVKLDENVSNTGSRPLQGQSPYILNSSLQFFDEKSGFSTALFVNRIGKRIAFVREKNGISPDLWENPRTVVDLSVSKKLNKHFDAKLTLNDLLAQDLIFYQDNNGNGKFDGFSKATLLDPAVPDAQKANIDNVVFKYKMGYTLSFGLSYKF